LLNTRKKFRLKRRKKLRFKKEKLDVKLNSSEDKRKSTKKPLEKPPLLLIMKQLPNMK
jgi:hypothetical protein